MNPEFLKGRAAGYAPSNLFLKQHVVQEFPEGLDEELISGRPKTEFIIVGTVNPLSKNDSPDLRLNYSVNPYQGCEHGCIYCYARNSHTYWGYDAGLGFETTILVKQGIDKALEKAFRRKDYQPATILLSGNTDCYQPAEKKFQLTRRVLETCLAFRHPVSIITKNVLVRRDIDLLEEMAGHRLVHIYFSINHVDDGLKSLLEPRTATADRKFKLMAEFSAKGIPCGVMVAPIIPGINMQDIDQIIAKSAAAGALGAGYTVVRLNGQLEELFREWLQRHFPDRVTKVINQIRELHGGSVNDSVWGRRMKGEGVLAQVIQQLFTRAVSRHLPGRTMPDYDFTQFVRGGQLNLFDV
ncbi:Radical SAM domain protein [Lunatimonas lonarensis]|uniref:Radical SAM domain protein n=1 Tax=Lunatimonas lonarensis TaxID=1232681 RepID=R7ZW37_9BACT|nr:PA0069 family radical SAM protein [Lunatimonas lonarensis]EON78209.1 Radical SAM domain protein [Lunatimonas lonarensis]